MGRPRTLFAKTAITLTIAIGVLLVFSVAAMVNFILVPLAKQGADDLAALMVLSAKTWVELPPATRPFLEQELMEQYQLELSVADGALPDRKSLLPFLRFLEKALTRRVGQPTEIRAKLEPEIWFCADIPMGGRTIRVSFPKERIGARPPTASLYVLAAGAVVILLTTLLLVRRLTRPLANLSEATSQLARGEVLDPLPETGPRELAELTRNFNRMSRELTELIENRTTLLAGVSHDLRTPLTRMRLVLEMLLPDQTDTTLISRLRQDMEEMDRLIGHALELARGLEPHKAEEVDLREFVDGIIADCRGPDSVIDWEPQSCCFCTVDTLALQRVLVNLIENAVRYGGNKPVQVRCACDQQTALIQVLDRGKGIPEAEREAVFRPFHRLEASRSRKTGGSGLGLAIARQLCDAHGWQVTLKPRAGGGTEASVEIPLNTTTA